MNELKNYLDEMTILFVDDEKAIVRSGSQMLEQLGYQVHSTTSSIEALEIFRKKTDTFDLVVTDMTMPKMTGLRMVSEMHVVRPDIPVIMATGNRAEISPEKAKEGGIRVFLIKPPSIGDLAKAVRHVLDSPKKACQGPSE